MSSNALSFIRRFPEACGQVGSESGWSDLDMLRERFRSLLDLLARARDGAGNAFTLRERLRQVMQAAVLQDPFPRTAPAVEGLA